MHLCRPLASIAFLFLMGQTFAAEVVLESRRLHLGKPGAWEWDEYKDRKVDAERLEIRFQGKPNSTEHALRIWQSQVKLNWPVMLNGRRLGSLTTAETAMESVFALPPGILKDGENVLVVDAAASLDDIEIGPVILMQEPVKTYLSGARIEVNVTDLDRFSKRLS